MSAAPPPGPLLAAFGRRQWLPVAVLAVCAALITLAASAGPHPHDPSLHLGLAFVVCAPILALRRWPLPVLAATTVASALAMGNAPLPFGIMVGVASYLAASRLPRRLSIPAAATTAVTLGGALVYAALTVRNAFVAQEAVETSCRWWRAGSPATAWRPAGATWPGWPSRPSGR